MNRRQKLIFILGWVMVIIVWFLGTLFQECEITRRNGWIIYKGNDCSEKLPTHSPYEPRKKFGYEWDNWV